MTIRLHPEHMQYISSLPAGTEAQHSDYISSPSFFPQVFPLETKSVSKLAPSAVDSLSVPSIARPVTPTPSCCSASDSSVSSFGSFDSDKSRRRVHFADRIVSDVWTRPYTEVEEVPKLFYSTKETAEFRQKYRVERKLQQEQEEAQDQRPLSKRSKHSIYKVVVKFRDTVETYVVDDPDGESVKGFGNTKNPVFDNDSFWTGSLTYF